MDFIEGVLKNISDDFHYQALKWFESHKSQEITWAELSARELVNKAKGIHKPARINYALSIKQTVKSAYKDATIHRYPDGSWSYQYVQEGKNGPEDDNLFTNRALANCMKDQIPVGVLIQTQKKPETVKYRVEGIAFIVGWENGYFLLRSATEERQDKIIEEQLQKPVIQAEIERLINIERLVDKVSQQPFNPKNIFDQRKKIVATIHQRQGQKAFRDSLIAAHQKCVVTGYQLTQILEAAHIYPYQGPETNHISNGLLLRSDIHALFDLGLLAVDTENMTIILSSELNGTEYEKYANQRLLLSKDERLHPSKEALDLHRKIVNL
jgi:putative restriction endonuclease